MRLKHGLKAVKALLVTNVPDAPAVDEAERIFRHIFHYLSIGSDKRYQPRREQANAIVLQMAKVASTSIQTALRERGINAFHSHGLSQPRHQAALSHVLGHDLTIPLVGGALRRHILNVALQMLVRWHQRYEQRNGHELRIVTVTRDPVTHYPSSLTERWKNTRSRILDWHGAHAAVRADETQAIAAFFLELASVIAEGRPSAGSTASDHCVSLARERWPKHPVVAHEVAALLSPLTWLDREITPLIGFDVLASSGFRECGWAERSNEGVKVLVLRFEDLTILLPQMQRFFALSELTLPRKNVSHTKRGSAEIRGAMNAMLDTSVGRACACELRASPYGTACGYDRLG